MAKSVKQRGTVGEDLIDGEKILYRAKLHWIIFIFPMLYVSLALSMIAYSAHLEIFIPSVFVKYSAYTVFGYGAILFFIQNIHRNTSRIYVTNQRVFIKMGVFVIESMSLNLSHIEVVEVKQDVFGRMLGYGAVQIEVSGGGGTKKPVKFLAHPGTLRKAIQTLSPKKSMH
jgi:uncharacterized membrane protein YdbT with pleckstrin-like domain